MEYSGKVVRRLTLTTLITGHDGAVQSATLDRLEQQQQSEQSSGVEPTQLH